MGSSSKAGAEEVIIWCRGIMFFGCSSTTVQAGFRCAIATCVAWPTGRPGQHSSKLLQLQADLLLPAVGTMLMESTSSTHQLRWLWLRQEGPIPSDQALQINSTANHGLSSPYLESLPSVEDIHSDSSAPPERRKTCTGSLPPSAR